MSDPHDVFSPEQEEFLRAHRIAALATGRKDGSPQLSHIAYAYDGNDIIISIKSYTAKWHNAIRQPKVSLLVHDGRKQLVIYGTAEAIDQEPERTELTAAVFRVLSGNPDMEVTDDFRKRLDDEKRTVLRVAATSATMND